MRTCLRPTSTVAALMLASCGGGTPSKPAAGPASTGLTLAATRAPTGPECGFKAAGSEDGGARVAPPGRYQYALHGTESLPGAEARDVALPDRLSAVVTPARTAGGLTCFGIGRVFSGRLRTADVYVLRGDDVYASGLGFSTPNFVATVLPRPAVLALDDSSTSWSGSFAGPTSGSYRVELIGRRTLRVGGRSVEAVGLDATAAYTGETEGRRTSRTWLGTRRRLVLAESGRMTLRLGGEVKRLRYRSRLLSLRPDAP